MAKKKPKPYERPAAKSGHIKVAPKSRAAKDNTKKWCEVSADGKRVTVH